MEHIRGYQYRLRPTDAQAALFRQYAGVCRLIYNAALEQRARYGSRYQLTNSKQQLELTLLRKEFDWIGAIPRTCQAQAMNDLDKAFFNFFAGRAAFPTPRKKGVNESFRFLGREIAIRRINSRWSELRLPKIGWVRYRDTRKIGGEIRNATVSLTPLGWQISIAVMFERETPERLPGIVGIDRGIAIPVMLDTGERHALPNALVKLERRARQAQRQLSRRKRGSKRYAKARKRVSALRAKAARIRNHWQHELTTDIVSRYGVVVLEKLKTQQMTRSAKGALEEPGKNVKAKSGLNRSILNVGWFGIESKLAYKLAERGGELAFVNPAYSSQTCSECEAVDARSRESQAVFMCISCGIEMNADRNAALVIKRRWNTAFQGVETERRFVCESPTILTAA